MNQHLTTEKTLDDLYVLADNINALRYSETLKLFDFTSNEYENKVFKTFFCGEPKIYSSLNLPVVLSQTYPNPIGTLMFYGCNYVISCRALPGVFDLDGYQIYQGINGTLFIYKYSPANPARPIDEALIAPPRIEFAESRDLQVVYSKASELLVKQLENQLNLTDELVRLTLTNRITELQTQAYLQGKGYSTAIQSNEGNQ